MAGPHGTAIRTENVTSFLAKRPLFPSLVLLFSTGLVWGSMPELQDVWSSVTGVEHAASGTAQAANSRKRAMRRVIITLQGVSGPQAIAAAKAQLLGSLPRSGYRVIRTYSHLPQMALEVSPNVLLMLRRSPHVVNVSDDGISRTQ